MVDMAQINARTAQDQLAVMGVHGGLAFLGPYEPGFWAYFTQSPEWNDGGPDPMDRWSKRVIDVIADDLGGTARYPFGTTPFPGFFDHAKQASGTWQSPLGMLVHADAGLLISYRGVLDFGPVELPHMDTPR